MSTTIINPEYRIKKAIKATVQMPLKQKLLETAQKSMKMQNPSHDTPEKHLNSSDT